MRWKDAVHSAWVCASSSICCNLIHFSLFTFHFSKLTLQFLSLQPIAYLRERGAERECVKSYLVLSYFLYCLISSFLSKFVYAVRNESNGLCKDKEFNYCNYFNYHFHFAGWQNIAMNSVRQFADINHFIFAVPHPFLLCVFFAIVKWSRNWKYEFGDEGKLRSEMLNSTIFLDQAYFF